MRSIKTLLNTANFEWKDSKGISDSVSVITIDIKGDDGKLLYTNTLICAPCTEGLLGFALNKLYLDEFEFWDNELRYFYNQIAEPRTYKTKGQIIIFSNPNGGESYGAELETLRLPDKTRKFHTYIFNFLDCPGNTEKELEIAKVGKNRAEIESTLLAVRTLSDKYYFTSEEVELSYDKELERTKGWFATGKETYWFLDVGAKVDQSCLTGCTVSVDEHDDKFTHINIFEIHVYPVGYPLSRVVGSIDETQASDGWHYEKSVREHLEEYQLVKGVNPVFGCDVTGNSGIVPLFLSVGVNARDITFSGPKKWAMYQRMKYFIELTKKLLHRVKSELFEYQMKRIVVTKLKTSVYNRVGHENEGDFDDVPDSVAGVIYLADNPQVTEPNFELI
jgi:hypothetical protein